MKSRSSNRKAEIDNLITSIDKSKWESKLEIQPQISDQDIYYENMNYLLNYSQGKEIAEPVMKQISQKEFRDHHEKSESSEHEDNEYEAERKEEAEEEFKIQEATSLHQYELAEEVSGPELKVKKISSKNFKHQSSKNHSIERRSPQKQPSKKQEEEEFSNNSFELINEAIQKQIKEGQVLPQDSAS